MVRLTDELRETRLSRSNRLVKDPARLSVLVIGAGSIGSNAVHLLVSMGVEDIVVVDDDVVAEENVYPAFFSSEHMGAKKVEAIQLDIYTRTGVDIATIVGRYPSAAEGFTDFDIVIIGTDSKASRVDAMRTMAEVLKPDGVWIDGRMGGPVCSVHALRNGDRKAFETYRDMLRGGGEDELPCGEKATAPITKGFLNGFIGMVVSAVANDAEIPVYQSFDMRNGMYIFVPEDQDGDGLGW